MVFDDEVPGVLVPDENYKEKSEQWKIGGEWL